MADLFVKQGHPEQAIPIYEKLLAADPANAALSAKLADARASATRTSSTIGVIPEPSRETEPTTEPPTISTPIPWDAAPKFGETSNPAAEPAEPVAPPVVPAMAKPAVPAAAAAAPSAPAAGPVDALERALDAVRANRRAPSPYPAFRGPS